MADQETRAGLRKLVQHQYITPTQAILIDRTIDDELAGNPNCPLAAEFKREIGLASSGKLNPAETAASLVSMSKDRRRQRSLFRRD